MSATELIQDVAARHQLTVAAVKGESHHPPCVAARREIAKTLRRQGWSFPRIGMALGGRHHSSIMHLVKGKRRKSSWSPAAEIQVPDLSGEWNI